MLLGDWQSKLSGMNMFRCSSLVGGESLLVSTLKKNKLLIYFVAFLFYSKWKGIVNEWVKLHGEQQSSSTMGKHKILIPLLINLIPLLAKTSIDDTKLESWPSYFES